MTTTEAQLTPAKRKRLLKRFGPAPAGSTAKELEQCLDLLYGLFSHMHIHEELRHIMVCDPFDRSQTPRQINEPDLTDWLEALVSSCHIPS